jgi:hypothetical protein
VSGRQRKPEAPTPAGEPRPIPPVAQAALDALPAGAEELPEDVKLAFATVVLRLEKRRKITLAGYLLSLLTMIIGLVGGLIFIAMGPGQFRGWILFVPFAVIGVIFWFFGRWAKRA